MGKINLTKEHFDKMCSFHINFNKQNYGNKQKKPDVYHQ